MPISSRGRCPWPGLQVGEPHGDASLTLLPRKRASTCNRWAPARACRSNGVASTIAPAPRAQLDSSHSSTSTAVVDMDGGSNLASVAWNVLSQCLHDDVPSPAMMTSSGSRAAIAGAAAHAETLRGCRVHSASFPVAAVSKFCQTGQTLARSKCP